MINAYNIYEVWSPYASEPEYPLIAFHRADYCHDPWESILDFLRFHSQTSHVLFLCEVDFDNEELGLAMVSVSMPCDDDPKTFVQKVAITCRK